MDCSPPGSSVHGISQGRILEWGAISYSRRSSWPRDLCYCQFLLLGFLSFFLWPYNTFSFLSFLYCIHISIVHWILSEVHVLLWLWPQMISAKPLLHGRADSLRLLQRWISGMQVVLHIRNVIWQAARPVERIEHLFLQGGETRMKQWQTLKGIKLVANRFPREGRDFLENHPEAASRLGKKGYRDN